MLTINHPITGAAHTLFPENGWSRGAVSWKRRWQTGVSTGITGNEKRAALRSLPLHEIMFHLTAVNVKERSRMDARVDQAKKSGLACSPFFGRGFTIAVDANAGANVVTVNANPTWTWQAGDYAILIRDDLTFDCIAVHGVAGNVLTLVGNLVNTWPAPTLCWPLIFGQFAAEPEAPSSGHLSSIQITISEMVSSRSAQLGVVPAGRPGVGAQMIGHSNLI